MTAPDHEQAERLTENVIDYMHERAERGYGVEIDANSALLILGRLDTLAAQLAEAQAKASSDADYTVELEAQLAERERALLRLYQSWRHESGCMMPPFVREALAATHSDSEAS